MIKMKTVVNAAIVRNKKVFLLKRGHFWILPGGKTLQAEESELECLCSGLKQQLPKSELYNISKDPYQHMIARTPISKEKFSSIVYFAKIRGDIASIESRWFDSSKDYNFSDPAAKLALCLTVDGYLKELVPKRVKRFF